jgi:hypothetical protein
MAIRQWVRGGVCLGCGLFGVALAPCAQARGLAGATELQLKTTLLQHDSSRSTATVASSTPGVPQPLLSPTHETSTSLGLMGSGYGAEVGYFVSDHFELGAGLQLTHGHSSGSGVPTDFSSSSTSLSFVPRIDYVFSGAVVRPYVAAFAGYSHRWTSGSGGSYDSSTHSSGFVFGAAIGAHFFLGDSWSFDPELAVLRAGDDGTQSTRGMTDAGPITMDYESKTRDTAVMLSVGLSGWLGGH